MRFHESDPGNHSQRLRCGIRNPQSVSTGGSFVNKLLAIHFVPAAFGFRLRFVSYSPDPR
jgi:hypothetical protein